MDRQSLLILCAALGAVCFLIRFRHWRVDKTVTSAKFKDFQRKYMAVFLLMKTADWLQGPYVYQLYADKGFTGADSSKLFVAGFTSSAFLGVMAGSCADKYGRKKGAMVFALFYALACLIYHQDDFYVLAIGRVFSGVATSLLFSVFEAWYQAEHAKLEFPDKWVSQTFSRVTLADSLLAILAGLFASFFSAYFDYSMASFDASFVCLVLGGMLVFFWWCENSSGSTSGTAGSTSVFSSLRTMWAKKEILLCGTVQALFGGTMYIFVYMWTPSLPDFDPGLVFSSFMVAIMIGTGLFDELQRWGYRLDEIVVLVCTLSAVALAVPVLSADPVHRFAGFVAYEVCIGIWFPSYHSLRMKIVPDEGHATILSFFRFPLNCIVIFTLLHDKWSVELTFSCCFFMLTLATIAATQIRRVLLRKEKEKAH